MLCPAFMHVLNLKLINACIKKEICLLFNPAKFRFTTQNSPHSTAQPAFLRYTIKGLFKRNLAFNQQHVARAQLSLLPEGRLAEQLF